MTPVVWSAKFFPYMNVKTIGYTVTELKSEGAFLCVIIKTCDQGFPSQFQTINPTVLLVVIDQRCRSKLQALFIFFIAQLLGIFSSAIAYITSEHFLTSISLGTTITIYW